MTENLINRITYHLSSGGLFNPELADHLAVRNLLMECREALAQPEQEPVACDGDFPEGFDASLGVPAQALRVANAIMCDVIGKREWDVPCTAQHVLSFAKKYTTPPQRTWVGLTDEEILSISADCASSHQHMDIHFARAIEAKLKEKNT